MIELQALLIVGLLDAVVGGALTAHLQRGEWDRDKQLIVNGYQFALAGSVTIWLLLFGGPDLVWRVAFLVAVYVEDLLYYLFLPFVSWVHYVLVGETQLNWDRKPYRLFELPERISGWLKWTPVKYLGRTAALRVALAGGLFYFWFLRTL